MPSFENREKNMARDSCLARVTAGVAIGGAVGGAVGNLETLFSFVFFWSLIVDIPKNLCLLGVLFDGLCLHFVRQIMNENFISC